ncbi:MAG: tRNA pseudouridine(54/55) synthase Pus10 [Natronomonas sp.]
MSLTDDARSLLASGPLCDACLGRPFADRSFGLRNEERGRGLRTTIALEDDEPFETTDPGDCWVCEGICGRFDELATRAVEALAGTELYTYQVGTRVPPLVAENDRLLREDAGLEADAGESLKRELNREVGRRVGATIGATVDFERPNVQILCDLEADSITVQHNSVSVYGRYKKLERGIPQTEWDTYETSVEELIAPPFLSTFRGTEAVFHGAGREDVDARMIGAGRPFVLEIKEPRRRNADLDTLRRAVNEGADGRVEVTDLAFVTHEAIERVKRLDATKRYRATVVFDGPVEAETFAAAMAELDGATLQQRTPNRVDHRRSDLVRERTVLDLDGELTDPRSATVEMRAEGGLYVKEFVSGDEGRTTPNLSDALGVDAEVTTLDVVDVTGEEGRFLVEEIRRAYDDDPVRP